MRAAGSLWLSRRRGGGGVGRAAVFLTLAVLALHANAADGDPTASNSNYSQEASFNTQQLVWNNGGSSVMSAALGCGAAAASAIAITFADVRLTRALPASAYDVECRFALVSEADTWSGSAGGGGGVEEEEEVGGSSFESSIPRMANRSDDAFWRNVSARVASVGGDTGVDVGVTRGVVVVGNSNDTHVVRCDVPAFGDATSPSALPAMKVGGNLTVAVAWREKQTSTENADEAAATAAAAAVWHVAKSSLEDAALLPFAAHTAEVRVQSSTFNTRKTGDLVEVRGGDFNVGDFSVGGMTCVFSGMQPAVSDGGMQSESSTAADDGSATNAEDPPTTTTPSVGSIDGGAGEGGIGTGDNATTHAGAQRIGVIGDSDAQQGAVRYQHVIYETTAIAVSSSVLGCVPPPAALEVDAVTVRWPARVTLSAATATVVGAGCEVVSLGGVSLSRLDLDANRTVSAASLRLPPVVAMTQHEYAVVEGADSAANSVDTTKKKQQGTAAGDAAASGTTTTTTTTNEDGDTSKGKVVNIVKVGLKLTAFDALLPVVATVELREMTANAGADFGFSAAETKKNGEAAVHKTITSVTMRWEAGDIVGYVRTVSVPVVDDGTHEGPIGERFEVVIASVVNGVAATAPLDASSVITIEDDDDPPVFAVVPHALAFRPHPTTNAGLDAGGMRIASSFFFSTSNTGNESSTSTSTSTSSSSSSSSSSTSSSSASSSYSSSSSFAKSGMSSLFSPPSYANATVTVRLVSGGAVQVECNLP
jgi:hypothetical protein